MPGYPYKGPLLSPIAFRHRPIKIQRPPDPFLESVETGVLIGSAHVYLECLDFLLDIDEDFVITDYKGTSQGLKT